MASKSKYALLLFGTGPGIGQAVAARFAKSRYNIIALVARSQKTVDTDRKVVEEAAPGAKVHTYTADVADKTQLTQTLKKIGAEIGTFETLYWNPAVIRPTKFEEETEEQMLYDFKARCPAHARIFKCHAVVQTLTVLDRSPIPRFCKPRNGPFPNWSRWPSQIRLRSPHS
jgi:short-subunit dehydrogenase